MLEVGFAFIYPHLYHSLYYVVHLFPVSDAAASFRIIGFAQRGLLNHGKEWLTIVLRSLIQMCCLMFQLDIRHGVLPLESHCCAIQSTLSMNVNHGKVVGLHEVSFGGILGGSGASVPGLAKLTII